MIETHKLAKEKGWVVGVDYPEWGNNSAYLTTINGGYLQESETPKNAYDRLAKRASELIKKPEFESKFLEIFWKGWLIPSTPVMANFGTEYNLPISCFGSVVGDSMYDIGRKNLEMLILSKHGGGTSYSFDNIRDIGSPIKGGKLGLSDGILPFMKMFDSSVVASRQGLTRRGATSLFLSTKSKQFKEFLKIRQPKGDVNTQCLNVHQGAIIDDEFMQKLVARDIKTVDTWKDVMKARLETGEPYLFFKDNVNKNLGENWKSNNLSVKHTNLCSEIMLPNDEKHTFVCCLSSLNLLKFDEFKNTDTVFLATIFLDAIIEEFIQKAKNIQGIEDSVRFAEKSRALGLGVMGWHSFLQSKNLPFIGIASNSWTNIIFGHIKNEAERASKWLAEEFGEPEWMKDTGKRNLTLTTIPPTRSSSKLAHNASQSIEPLNSNIYSDASAKGTMIVRNQFLEKLLTEKGMNTIEIWDNISDCDGSVQHLDFLTKDEKDVFLTFREINQLELIKQASLRQKYICQGQSLNLAFFQDASAKWINKVHITAWELGLKSLYYLKSQSKIRVSNVNQRDLYTECLNCEG